MIIQLLCDKCKECRNKKKNHKSKEWFPVYSEPHIPEAVIMNILSLSPYLWDTLTQTDMQIVILSDSSSTV